MRKLVSALTHLSAKLQLPEDSMPLDSFETIRAGTAGGAPPAVAVAAADDREVLQAICDAAKDEDLSKFIL